jgi:hypothetical protein
MTSKSLEKEWFELKSAAKGIERFVRYDYSGDYFETVVRKYADGKNDICLIGCRHLAEKKYFDEIKNIAEDYDKILYEGVEKNSKIFKKLIKIKANRLEKKSGLKHQLNCIDYDNLSDKWEYCDVPFMEMLRNMLKPSEISKLLKALRGDIEAASECWLNWGRTKKVKDRLKHIFDDENIKSVAVLYGAGHMPDIEDHIMKMGFRPKEERWLRTH